jgi:signal transduction histidine kinase
VVAAPTARASSLEAMGAKVAHEVRNPLSAIRGLVEVSAEKNTDERDRKRLAVVLGEVDRIDEILRGYLALARPLDQLQPQPVDLGQLVREVAAVIEARAERAGVGLTVEGDGAVISVDPRRIKEALLNLLLNAIEATPPGGQVALRASPTADGVALSVEDSGPGMRPEQLAAAGTPFSTQRPGGTGLGLALARQAAEQHGGSLALDSAPGRGTVARLSLPRTVSS